MRKILDFALLTTITLLDSVMLGTMLKLAFIEPIVLIILLPVYFGMIFIIITYLIYTIDMLNELEPEK